MGVATASGSGRALRVTYVKDVKIHAQCVSAQLVSRAQSV